MNIRQPAADEEPGWPQAYEPPVVEPLGTVWERTGGSALGTGDNLGIATT